ncbi:MAG: tetratricopeptide repeat protein [Candidatus Obscuribacterales bacterium]
MDSVLANDQTSNPYFGQYDLPPKLVLKIAQLFDEKTLSAFSQVNNAWYRAVKGHAVIIQLNPNDPIPGRYKGDHYSCYQILWQVNREEAARISEAVGMEISFPSPETKEVPVLIGKGGFGEFRIAKVVGEERYVGVKITKSTKQIEKEALIQETLTGLPHLMPSLDFRAAQVSGRLQLFQAMPLAGLGNLSRDRDPKAPNKPTLGELIQGLQDHGFREQLIYHIAHSSLVGLDGMHGNHLFHMDFKGDNLVVDVNGEVWVIDFGCSGLSKSGYEDTVKLLGDRRYFPFERTYCEKRRDHTPLSLARIDIWALGITLLELIHPGGNPFSMRAYPLLYSENDYKLRLEKIEALKDAAPDSFGSFLKHLLTVIPAGRPKAAQALQHPWIVKMSKAADQWLPSCKGRLSEMVREHKRRAWMTGFPSSIGQMLTQKKPREVEEDLYSFLTPIPSPYSLLAAVGPSEPDPYAWPEDVGHEELSPPDLTVPVEAPRDLLSPQTLPLPLFTDFIPRLTLQKTLEDRLFSNQSLTVLQGMGGSGKTKMAQYLLYLDKVRHHFGQRLWFNSVTRKNSLETQILLLTTELRLVEPKASMEEAVRAFQRYLKEQPKPFLIVFDNADDPRSLLPYLPKENGHVLITTRNASWTGAIPVGVLSEEESLLLIEKLLQQQDPDSGKLAQALGHLPLGLCQACAYIRNHNLPISDYLNLLTQNTSSLIGQNESLFGKDLPSAMGAMWETTFKTLEEKCPEALQLLDAIAYLAPDNIPESLVLTLTNKGSVVDSLMQYALISKVEKGLSIHRLTQAIRKSKHDPQTQLALIEEILDAFTDSFNPYKASKAEIRNFLPHGEALTEELKAPSLGGVLIAQEPLLFFYGYMGKSHDVLQQYRLQLAAWRKYLEVALELKDRDGQGTGYCNLGNAYENLGEYRKAIELQEEHIRIALELEDKEGEGAAYCNLGVSYRNLGEYRKAIEMHDKHLQIALQLEDKVGEGLAYGNLGIAYDSLGEYRQAIEFHEKDLQIALELEDKEGEGRAYGNLGIAYRNLGEYRKAIEMHDKHLQIALELEDKHGEGLAYGSLGNAYSCLGEYRKAIEFHEKDLQIALQLGDRGGEGAAYCNLGVSYRRLGEHRKAIELHERSLKIALELEDKHGEGLAYGSLGNAYSCLGEYRKAIELHQKHLLIALELENRDGEGAAYCNLGNAYCWLGEYRKGIELYEKDLQIALQLEDKDKEGSAYGNLGFAYDDLGEYLLALDCFKKCVEALVPVLGAAHPHLGQFLNGWADTLRKMGQLNEALERAQNGLQIVRDAHGEEHTDVSYGLRVLGIIFHRLGRLNEAKDALLQAISIRRKVQGDKHPSLGTDLYSYGELLSTLMEGEEAAKVCKESILVLQEALGAEHPELARAHHALGLVYEASGNIENAREHFRIACEIALKHPCMGKDHPEAKRFVQDFEAINVVQQLI